MDEIDRLLNPDQGALRQALERAHEERRLLVERLRSLDDAIERGEAALRDGDDEPDRGTAGVPRRPIPPRLSPGAARTPLHEALATVLRAHGNRPMTARALADEVNRQGLYRRGDGERLEYGQVHARVHAYPHMFVRESGGIRLRDEELEVHDAATLAAFDDAMLEVYNTALREVGYAARRFLGMIHRYGGHAAARHLLAKPGPSEGFKKLAEAHLLNVTMEFQVLRPEFRGLFAPDELSTARQRLLEAGFSSAQLPSTMA